MSSQACLRRPNSARSIGPRLCLFIPFTKCITKASPVVCYTLRFPPLMIVLNFSLYYWFFLNITFHSLNPSHLQINIPEPCIYQLPLWGIVHHGFQASHLFSWDQSLIWCFYYTLTTDSLAGLTILKGMVESFLVVFFNRAWEDKCIKQLLLHTEVCQCFVWDPKRQISNQRQSVLLKSEYCLIFQSDPETKAWPHHENLFSSQWLISTPMLLTFFI